MATLTGSIVALLATAGRLPVLKSNNLLLCPWIVQGMLRFLPAVTALSPRSRNMELLITVRVLFDVA